jgi:hypothetical protein
LAHGLAGNWLAIMQAPAVFENVPAVYPVSRFLVANPNAPMQKPHRSIASLGWFISGRTARNPQPQGVEE